MKLREEYGEWYARTYGSRLISGWKSAGDFHTHLLLKDLKCPHCGGKVAFICIVEDVGAGINGWKVMCAETPEKRADQCPPIMEEWEPSAFRAAAKAIAPR